jgi:hypothetical protein
LWERLLAAITIIEKQLSRLKAAPTNCFKLKEKYVFKPASPAEKLPDHRRLPESEGFFKYGKQFPFAATHSGAFDCRGQ